MYVGSLTSNVYAGNMLGSEKVRSQGEQLPNTFSRGQFFVCFFFFSFLRAHQVTHSLQHGSSLIQSLGPFHSVSDPSRQNDQLVAYVKSSMATFKY